MASVHIRAGTAEDAPIILEMIRDLAEYEKLTHAVAATEEKIRATLFGEKPAADVLLAYDGTEAVGFAVFFSTYSTFLAQPGIYLEDVFVKPHARGKGVGLALLRTIAAIAHVRECGRVEWDVLDWNEPAITFYKKLGAVPVEGWTKYRLTGEALANLASL